MVACDTNLFVGKAAHIFGDLYDYSQVTYKKSCIKIKIICRLHGVFETTPNNHLRDMGNCPVCAEKSRAEKRRRTTEQFIALASAVHGSEKYDYSKVSYAGNSTEVEIVCKKPGHGSFFQFPGVHLADKGCPICGKWSLLTTEIFLERSKKVHGEKYDYSQSVYVSTRTKIKIICRKHGLFEQLPLSHMNKGCGCRFCKESKGEIKIAEFLDENKIAYLREKTFELCKSVKYLFFDFYIPSLNLCIEFDGIQHFQPIEYFGGDTVFEGTKRSDAIKTAFCLKMGIRLIRIPYTELSQLDISLKDLLTSDKK